MGTRTVYACVSEDGDHVLDAFKVFAIAVWLKKDFNTTPKLSLEMGTGVSSWSRPKKMEVNKIEWRLKIENKEELSITKEFYRSGFEYFLQTELVRFQLEGKPELLEYLQKEITRLNELHKEI